jgi:hypothetical protein
VPELRVNHGSGRQVDVLLPIEGTVTLMGKKISILKGEKLIVVTQHAD